MQIISGKGQSDQNTYAHIQLDNDLNVVLVSDPKAEKPAAALAIKVGSYQDPDDHLGLAHLLEHMLFLGTEKYPEANAYQEFIRQHGGSHNAYTSGQVTNYYFDILPSAYSEALDRFAQFFISPKLDPQYIAREINAVDSEYRAKLSDEQRRSNQAFKTLLNPDHPGSRFTVGNKDTLANTSAEELRSKLVTLYQHYYNPSNMVLTLTANESTDALAKIAQKHFGGIKSHQPLPHLTLPKQFTSNADGKIQLFKTNTEKSIVKFSFQIPSQINSYSSQPIRYISYVLGDESENSLFAYLKKQHWAQALHAGINQDDGTHALFTITIKLTDEGIAQRDKISEALFKTIDNLKSSPISKQYLNETKTLSALNYNFHDYIQPIKLSQILSSRALDVGIESLLSSFHISQNANSESIKSLLNTLTQENLIIQWLNPEHFPENWLKESIEWTHEPLYNGQYANGNIAFNINQIVQHSELDSHFGLPKANPFMPDNLDLLPPSDVQENTSIEQDQGFNFWFKQNTHFQKPTGMIFGYFGFLENPSTKDRLLLQLWAKLFNDAASERTYQPYMAGLGYQLYAHGNGLTLRTSGYNDKQDDFFYSLVEYLLEFRATKERLSIAKKDVLKGLSNLESQPPYALARHYFSQVAIKGNAPTHTLQELVTQISLNDVNNFIERHSQHFEFSGYMTGNFVLKDAQSLSKRVKNAVVTCLYNHKYRHVELKNFQARQHYLYQFSTQSADSVVLYSLIATDNNNASYLERCYIRVLSQLLGAQFYNEFRTEKQFGYIVAVTNQTIEKTPSIGFLVQSPNTSTEKLVAEIERFIKARKWGNNDISDDEFEKARAAVLGAYQKQPTSIKEQALEEWPHIVEPEHNFADRQNWINALETMTKKEFLSYMQEKVENNQAARLLVTNQWQDTQNWQPLNIE
ncbi:insulinase family protein [Marinomonas ostreistagni]|uniref:Protease 3 n=1 Tax=Marinomonas ostreistagni TaxID=359209 RepID=A0ABS0Z908_9GAMM|nr:insulinase family protein [Marinomonas ostreistagni]MBJ7550139.1 insulinase family protein [Marinomonas ostreistagni]